MVERDLDGGYDGRGQYGGPQDLVLVQILRLRREIRNPYGERRIFVYRCYAVGDSYSKVKVELLPTLQKYTTFSFSGRGDIGIRERHQQGTPCYSYMGVLRG